MKKQLQIIILLFAACAFTMGQIIAVESFDYDIGDDVFSEEGGEGWAGPWTQFWEGDPAGFTVDVAGLLPDGVDIAPIGNRLRGEVLSATGFRIRRELETPLTDDGSEIWISFLIESENAIGDSWQGVSLWGSAEDGSSELSLFGKNWGPTNYGAVVGGQGVDSETLVEDNMQVWLVVKIEFSGDDANETVYMWVNPDPGTEPATEDADVVNANGSITQEVTHIACHFGNTQGIVLYFDELMLAYTYDEVVPKEDVGINNVNISARNSICYPNPSSDFFTIDFNVNYKESVKLDIYNILGEKVETLMDGTQSAGNYKLLWNATNHPSGTYFYNLQIGDKTEISKILVK